jgi:DNA-binding response OmpR family regulator
MLEILVIEDDRDFNEALCNMLIKQGYGVFKAMNGRDGINLFKAHPADLVITDILLPDREGLNVILDLKRFLPNVKIIAISGGGHCASGEEYLSDIQLLSGVQHTLTKPFHRDELIKMIHEVLD